MHSIRKSKLVRGSTIFDEAVILHGNDVAYVHETDQLCAFLTDLLRRKLDQFHVWLCRTSLP